MLVAVARLGLLGDGVHRGLAVHGAVVRGDEADRDAHEEPDDGRDADVDTSRDVAGAGGGASIRYASPKVGDGHDEGRAEGAHVERVWGLPPSLVRTKKVPTMESRGCPPRR